jgi:Ca2+ transporting ATPase
MTIFNEINSRKLGESEYNVFAGFFNNCIFIIILLITIVVQIAMVQYGGQPLRCVPLTPNEHLFCAALGFFSLIWGKFYYHIITNRSFRYIRKGCAS